MKTGYRIVVLVCFLLLSGAGVAPGAIPLSRNMGVVSARGHLAFARDPTGLVDIDERAGLEWLSVDDRGDQEWAFGYSADAVWLRLEVENKTGEDFDALVELPVARMNRLTWFVLDGDRVTAETSDGLEWPRRDQAIRTRHPVVSFALPAGTVRAVYLRVWSDSSLRFPLLVSSSTGYVSYAARRDLFDYALLGVGMAVFFLSLFNGWIQRSRLFLLLAVIALGFLGYYYIFQGYYVWLGGPCQYWVNRQWMLALGLLGLWGFFTFTLVCVSGEGSVHRVFPRMSRISWLLGAGVAAIGVLPFRAGVFVLLGLLNVCFPCGVFVAFRSAGKKRHWFDWMLAFVWASVVLVVWMLYAHFFGLAPALFTAGHLQRMLMLFILLVFFIIVTAHQKTARQERERARQAEQLVAEARLRALRYQLNPHFLFNTLTSIDALSRQAPERISSVVRRLARYLRLRLEPATDGMTQLARECNSIRAYLDIEQVRFEEDLRTHYRIGDNVLNARVPEMLLQPLVENAIKHGFPPEGILEIRISARREDGKLLLRVENNGHLKAAGNGERPGGGIGLRNLKDRLANLYGQAARFELREADGLVVAEIRLPFEEIS